jgi:CBS domain-containing protein
MLSRQLVPDVLKTQTLIYLPSTATVREAVRLMVDRKVAAVLVVDSGRLLGIFTERDVTRRIVAVDRDPDQTKLADVMSSDPCVVAPDTSAIEALDLMEREHVRHLPVVESDGTVWGIVSIRDLFSVVRAALVDEINDRDEFIRGDAYSVARPN